MIININSKIAARNGLVILTKYGLRQESKRLIERIRAKQVFPKPIIIMITCLNNYNTNSRF